MGVLGSCDAGYRCYTWVVAYCRLCVTHQYYVVNEGMHSVVLCIPGCVWPVLCWPKSDSRALTC